MTASCGAGEQPTVYHCKSKSNSFVASEDGVFRQRCRCNVRGGGDKYKGMKANEKIRHQKMAAREEDGGRA